MHDYPESWQDNISIVLFCFVDTALHTRAQDSHDTDFLVSPHTCDVYSDVCECSDASNWRQGEMGCGGRSSKPRNAIGGGLSVVVTGAR